MKKIILVTICGLLVIAGGVLVWLWQSAPQTNVVQTDDPVEIVYWSVFERKEDIQPLLDEFQAKNPKIIVKYEQRNVRNYRQQIENLAGSAQGPDVFRFHNSWAKTTQRVLARVPEAVVQQVGLATDYYPVVRDELKDADGAYLGVPLMYDGLGLYYNVQLMRDAGVGQPPNNWQDIVDPDNGIWKKLLVSRDGISVAAIGMGSTANVDHWQDVFAFLMFQNGANLALPNSTRQETESALRFFKNGVRMGLWSEQLPRTTEAFAQGKLAMMFGVSWRAFEIQSMNPQLQFAVAPLPQLPGSKVGYASYWSEGVALRSAPAEQAAAWALLNFLSEKEKLTRRFGLESANRLFGEPYPRVSLGNNLVKNNYINGILETAPQAESWYLADKTYGDGFNEQLAQEYAKYINGALTIDQLELSVQNVLKSVQ